MKKKYKKINPQLGMPTTLLFQQYGSLLWDAFDEVPYHVGSSLIGNKWRDVDVRIILPDDEYKKIYGNPARPHENARWVATVLAFSLLGKTITGLPIDFQIQSMTEANKDKGARSAIGIIPSRIKTFKEK